VSEGQVDGNRHRSKIEEGREGEMEKEEAEKTYHCHPSQLLELNRDLRLEACASSEQAC
jgi:hypothetical protein